MKHYYEKKGIKIGQLLKSIYVYLYFTSFNLLILKPLYGGTKSVYPRIHANPDRRCPSHRIKVKRTKVSGSKQIRIKKQVKEGIA